MATNQKYQVNVTYLDIKNKKNIFSSPIGILKKGDIVEVKNINFLWATIIYKNQIAYVYAYGLTEYIEEIKGLIFIQYLDENNNELLPTEAITQVELETYQYSAKDIQGYSLTSESNVSVTLTEDTPNQTITFTYSKIYGSATIQYLDENNVELLPTETLTQLELGTYQHSAKDIQGYSLTSQSDVSITLTETNPHQTITFTYSKIYGSVTIQYLDDNQVELLSTQTFTPLELGTYRYSAKDIQGYSLTSQSDVSITLTEVNPHQTITFTYDKIYGSVTIQYVDENNVELLPSEMFTQLELGTYQHSAKDIQGYSLTSQSDVSITLTETNPHQTITFTYSKIYGSVTIQYLDDNQVELLSTQTFTPLELGTYRYSAKDIQGYSLTSQSDVSITLTEVNPHQTITFTYSKIYGSVTIQYLDENNVELLPSEIFTQLELGTYQHSAKDIQGYSLTSQSDVSITLTETNPHQTITFTYSKIYGSVTIQYLDDNQVELLSTQTFTPLELGTYRYSAKDIQGYSLTLQSDVSITLTEVNPHQTITFTYSKIYGSVTIQYLDENNVELLPSEMFTQLELGTYTYEAITIEGYSLMTTTRITVILNAQDANQKIIFQYKKEEKTEFLPLDESLQNEVPYISTYYIKPIVAPGEEVIIDYYITDYYHKEYTDDDYSDTFIVTVHIEGHPDIILRNLKAGDHSVNLGSFTLEREQKFSILCTDQYGRNSHELFNFFLVRTEPEVIEYIMTEDDLITYNIKNTDDYEELLEVSLTLKTVNATTVKEGLTEFASAYTPKPNTYTCFLPKTSDTDDPAKWWASLVTKYADDYDKEIVATESQNTRAGIQQLLDDKAAQGYNKIKLLPGTYRIDHTGTIYIPSKLTLDLNQAKIKLNQFTGNGALMITLNNTFDSHVINGTIEGDFYSHDYVGSPNNSEWVNGISIGGEAKYSSFENLEIKNITGYGSTNGIANSRDKSLGYTYIYPREIGNNFKIGDIDQATGLDITSTNRTTSDFRDISGYSEIGYLTISVYLGYQGNPCGTWNLISHFYDVNKNYITSTSSYQYRRIGVPKNAKYLRVTILNESYPTNLSVQLFRVPTHCSFQNCHHDNCRCVGMAPAAMKDMLVSNCEFTRCGRSGANCAYDAEDGWDMMQDVTFRDLNFYNNVGNDFLTCAGHNFIVENQIAGAQYIWERTHSIVIRNCTNLSKATYHYADIIKHGISRIYNNTYTQTCSSNKNIIKNSNGYIINGIVTNSNLTYIGNGIYKNCSFLFDNSESPYLSTCILYQCTISAKDEVTDVNLKFNNENGQFLFENCLFPNKTYLNSNNNFSNAIFKKCSFEDIHMKVFVTTNENKILFEDCNFTIHSYDHFIYISPFAYSMGISNLTFNNCIIKVATSNIEFKLIYAYSKPNNSLYEFNECTIEQETGTILEWSNFYKENFENFKILFKNCNKINIPYTSNISSDLLNSKIFIKEL